MMRKYTAVELSMILSAFVTGRCAVCTGDVEQRRVHPYVIVDPDECLRSLEERGAA